MRAAYELLRSILIANRMHIWAERYDRKLEDALAVQDEVARKIVAMLAVRVKKAETERVCARPPAAWRGRRLLQQALVIDPTYARALAALSSCYISQWVHRWDDDCPWSEALDRSYQAARESVRLAPELPEAHIALGQALIFLRQHEAALTAVERATALNPNMTSFRFAYIYVLAGEAARAMQLLEMHMRLDPFYEPKVLLTTCLGATRTRCRSYRRQSREHPTWLTGATCPR